MKTLLVQREIEIPEGFEASIKAGIVTVTHERGELKKNFKHAKLLIEKSKDGKKILVKKYMSNRRGAALVRTIQTQILNMFTGLKRGYQYKMRLVYNHFPIQATIEDNGTRVSRSNHKSFANRHK
mmetsp:Transcript_17673/g.24669  ORF Transcript_17673/g.24669 Transcript_17673/m.24669 type:complete len:125 (-) Transcript_17673:563-937(-)